MALLKLLFDQDCISHSTCFFPVATVLFPNTLENNSLRDSHIVSAFRTGTADE